MRSFVRDIKKRFFNILGFIISRETRSKKVLWTHFCIQKYLPAGVTISGRFASSKNISKSFCEISNTAAASADILQQQTENISKKKYSKLYVLKVVFFSCKILYLLLVHFFSILQEQATHNKLKRNYLATELFTVRLLYLFTAEPIVCCWL